MPLPLFPDDIPVSESEVQHWLDLVPHLSALPSRREAYRKAYNIEGKIRQLKLSGKWDNDPANPINKTS